MRVPTYNETTVTEVAVPVTQQRDAPAGAFGGQIGQGLSHVAGVMQQIQDDADNLRALDADNQAAEKLLDLTWGPETGFFNVKGRDVLTKTADGKSLSQSYIEQARKVGADIEGELVNESQKAKFRQRFEQRLLSFKESGLKHEIRETTEYAKTVTDASVKLETDLALKQWNDPAAVDQSISRITDSLRAQGMREGWGADVQKVIIADKVSKLHSGVIAMALEAQNLSYASDYLKKYSKDMEAGDILKYKGAIDKELQNNESVTVANVVMEGARSSIDPTDLGRLMHLVRGQESGNRQTDDKGMPITSVKGATGIAQVMPETGKEIAKRMGIAWDETRFKQDAAYNNALGENELAFNLKTYGGDVGKALAAYNGGRGRLDKAIAMAEKDGTKSYLDFMPKETQDYVAKITSRYSSGLGGQDRPTLEDMQSSVRQKMVGKPASQVKVAVDHVTQLYDTQTKAIKQREDDAIDKAYKTLDANGGDYAALPASIRSAIPGDKIKSIQEYAVFRAKGVEAATDWNVYYELRKDPALLKTTNLLAFKDKLSDTDFKALVTEQDNLRSGKTESLTATSSASQVLNAYLREAGIDPSPKPSKDENSDAAMVGRAMRAQQVAITEAEIAKGKKLSPDEVEKVTAKLFTNVQVKGSWFGTNDKQLFDLRDSDKIVVPSAERTQIIAALEAKKRPVNEAVILDMYKRKNNLTR